jgi:hypothetical protein
VHDRQSDSATRGNGVAAIARDRLLLREVNDRIAELADGWNETGVSLFVCECSGRGCAQALEITAAEYQRIRADESHVVVFPGHEQPESERVVERGGRFVVVAKPEPGGANGRVYEDRRDG